jgi:AcrR family transcriptional regulator
MTAASNRVRARQARRRAEILRAALEAFRDKGYHATTLDDIACRLGIRNTALYHYFADKEAILYACHQESLAELERMLEDARQHGRDARGRLAFLVREHVRVMIDTLAASPLAFEVSSLTPTHQDEVIRRRDQYERAVRDLITEGIDAGEFRALDPKTATFAILGAINWIARWYRPGGGLPASTLGQDFAEHLVGGLT